MVSSGEMLTICHFAKIRFSFLPPANEVCEGYVFTRVCLSTGRGSTYAGPPPGQVHPPGTRYTPWDQETPPTRYIPWTRYTSPRPDTPPGPGTHPVDQVHAPWPGTSLDQVHPQIRYTPRTRYTPRAVHAGRYRQQTGGKHPTGMHSCLGQKFKVLKWRVE